jgi:uncharacterized membrane protein YphA (DoxX/SURF4 family)
MARNVRTIGAWVISALLAAMFLMAGVPKLLGVTAHVEHFAHWGYPDWFRLVVGAIETSSAVLLLVPRTAAVGAAGIMTIMLGATYTHLFRAEDEAGRVPFTMALFLLAALAAYLRTRRPAPAN